MDNGDKVFTVDDYWITHNNPQKVAAQKAAAEQKAVQRVAKREERAAKREEKKNKKGKGKETASRKRKFSAE